jgi:7,8-dihydro-6-hydroxymethylpterin-pyrophosphokinase
VPRGKVVENAKVWIASGENYDKRASKAMKDGQAAAKLFETKGVMTDILTAIDKEDQRAFANACVKAGISNSDLITRMWNATMGSLDPQSAKPCW